MDHLNKNILIQKIFSAGLSLWLSFFSISSFADNPSTILNRTQKEGLTLKTSLDLNVMKTIPVQVPYTVEVPYDVEESYTVQIPYQETETYYENVPYEERIPYQETETYYENESRCETITTPGREECRTERLCEPAPDQCQIVEECGVNIHGQRICKPRKVCEPGQRECRDVRQCQTVGGGTSQQCHNVQVPRTRTVTRYRIETRYRQEQRTRTVTQYRTETRYRQEERTRTVTRYRTETRYRQELNTRIVTRYREEVRTHMVTHYRTEQRCCRTEMQSVLDYNFIQNVEINFPEIALLVENEKEQITVKLTGTKDNPTVSVSAKGPFFYEVTDTLTNGMQTLIKLKVKPQWNLSNLGEKSIRGLQLKIAQGESSYVVFQDSGLVGRVKSSYMAIIKNQNGQVVSQVTGEGRGIGNVSLKTEGNLDRFDKYSIELKVRRNGIVIEGGSIEFGVFAKYDIPELTAADVEQLQDSSKLQVVDIAGKNSEATLIFNDLTHDHPLIATDYEISLHRKSFRGVLKVFHHSTLSRASLKGQNKIRLKELGVSQEDLSKYVIPGKKIWVTIKVIRKSTSPLFPPEGIEFEEKNDFAIRDE